MINIKELENIVKKSNKLFIENKNNLLIDWSFLFLNKKSINNYIIYKNKLKYIQDNNDDESIKFKNLFLEIIYDQIQQYLIFQEFKNINNKEELYNMINYLILQKKYKNNSFLNELKLYIDSNQDLELLYKLLIININNDIQNIKDYSNYLEDNYFSNEQVFDKSIVNDKKNDFINSFL